MEIKITKVTRKYPTFSELHCGDIFIPQFNDNRVYMKGVYNENHKTKAIRLTDGCIVDVGGDMLVIPCRATLNVEMDKD